MPKMQIRISRPSLQGIGTEQCGCIPAFSWPGRNRGGSWVSRLFYILW